MNTPACTPSHRVAPLAAALAGIAAVLMALPPRAARAQTTTTLGGSYTTTQPRPRL